MKDLFIPILDTAVTTEAAMAALRETIFWTVVNNTARNNRVNEAEFERMKKTAECAAQSSTVELYCDDRMVDYFNFTEGCCCQFRNLQKIFNAILQYQAWYENEELKAVVGCNSGFCWNFNNHYYCFIFRQ